MKNYTKTAKYSKKGAAPHSKRKGKHSSVRKKNQNQSTLVAIPKPQTEPMPLNKYLAQCGLCSRRAAVTWIKNGEVSLDGECVTNPAIKVTHQSNISYQGKKITPQTKSIYIALNKPKDYLCTHQDAKNRKTIYALIHAYESERLHSVGRLDRNTTGVILLTNDGDFTQRLAHPSFEVEKVYHAVLDKPLKISDMQQLIHGIALEDGTARADEAAYVNEADKRHIGLSIHNGKNRVVRRMFEKLGYDVAALDRVRFGSISKKNIPRGKYRLLKEAEVRQLKFFLPKSVKKNKPEQQKQSSHKND